MTSLQTAHGPLPLPTFLPDATRGVVRALGAEDVAACGIDGLMINTLHLANHPGISVVAACGGIHRFMGWSGPVCSDSGGFQVLSLLGGAPGHGGVSRRGFTYRLGRGRKSLTPEKAIARQLRLGADIIFCLDDCTRPSDPPARQRESVEHTVEWARRCRAEFEHRTAGAARPGRPQKAKAAQVAATTSRPLLFAAVQGGEDPELRRECAERLLAIGFDGFGFGGWPLTDDGELVDMVARVAELLPGFPLHALGIGKPENVVRSFRFGYDIFDCTIATRDARHGRLYFWSEYAGESGAMPGRTDAGGVRLEGRAFYQHLYMRDEKHARDSRPVDAGCDCLCCRTYSRAYLRHLFRIRDTLAARLATLHNLRFYAQLIGRLRSLPRARS